MGDLQQQKLLVLRSVNDLEHTMELIRSWNGVPISFPVIEIVPPEDYAPMEEAILSLQQFNWIIFPSAHSVHFFMQCYVDMGNEINDFPEVHIAVIGPSTKQKAQSWGLKVDFMSHKANATAFLEEFKNTYTIDAQWFLLPLSNIARRTLPDGLRKAGGIVTEFTAYLNEPVEEIDHEIIERLKQGKIDWVLFTSPSTARNLYKILRDNPQALEKIRAASIGPTTSSALNDLGIPILIEAQDHTLDGLLQAIADFQLPSQ